MVLQIFVSAEPFEAYKAVWKYVYIIMFYREIYFLILCVYISHMCGWPQRPEKGIWSLGAEL